MGKIRKMKKLLHKPAVKSKQAKMEIPVHVDIARSVTKPSVPPSLQADNIFSALNISEDLLKQKLPDFDACSTITSKTVKQLQEKKKDRRKLKHQLFLKKLNLLDAADAREKEKKRKRRTPIVGDLTELNDALPDTLHLYLKNSADEVARTKQAKPKPFLKEKQRQKQMMQDISLFKQVLDHPVYQKNPLSTISEHLHNKQIHEDQMHL